jgi:hypothetical protein
MKKILPVFILIIALVSSCTLEKRRYMKGYYFKKNKKVETTPNTTPTANTSTPTTNSTNQATNNSTNQGAQSPPAIPSPQPKSIPAFCLYGGLEDGVCSISLNAEKIFCFTPYFDCFARAGFGFSDLGKSYLYKKYIFSGGIAAGLPMLKLGAEYGYSGFMNGNPGSQFCEGFIRFVPRRKSVYLKFALWKPINDPENTQLNFSAGLGISF